MKPSAILFALFLASMGFHSAEARKLVTLYSFTGASDGNRPVAGLIRDEQRNLYGTTLGGSAGDGTVFKLAPDGTIHILHPFAGPDREGPEGPMIEDKEGNLIGTTVSGGDYGDGVVFKLAPDGTETVLHSFSGKDGAFPAAGVIADKKDNLFGTTEQGGVYDRGTVYKIAHGKEKVLHSFNGGTDGDSPRASLIEDADNNLYGTTASGGSSGNGTIFKVTMGGVETVLHSFGDLSEGELPYSSLVMDSGGNLYGTTNQGGSDTCFCGTVFRLAADNTYSVLHAFQGGNDGAQPWAGLVMDSNGRLFGTTTSGGAHNAGTVFKITPSGGEVVLYMFAYGNDGAVPYGDLILDTKGDLYGTASAGGAFDGGAVFELK